MRDDFGLTFRILLSGRGRHVHGKEFAALERVAQGVGTGSLGWPQELDTVGEVFADAHEDESLALLGNTVKECLEDARLHEFVAQLVDDLTDDSERLAVVVGKQSTHILTEEHLGLRFLDDTGKLKKEGSARIVETRTMPCVGECLTGEPPAHEVDLATKTGEVNG